MGEDVQVGLCRGTGKHLARLEVAVEWGWLFERHSCPARDVTLHPRGKEDMPTLLKGAGLRGC